MQIEETKSRERHMCCRCGSMLTMTKFMKSLSGFYAAIGHIPICLGCLEREYRRYRIEYQDPYKAMQRICMAFDLYYDRSMLEPLLVNEDTLFTNYMKMVNLSQYKSRTFDTSVEEGFMFNDSNPFGSGSKRGGKKSERLLEKQPSAKLVDKWGEGLTNIDYNELEKHYKYLKSANPNSDSNQEIFILDLCYIKMQQLKAIREGDADDFGKLTESYRKTFSQAGLRTVQDESTVNEDCWSAWTQVVSQYTPEEYYMDKELYKDIDGIGEYYQRHAIRPLNNTINGTTERDSEYFVSESDDADE